MPLLKQRALVDRDRSRETRPVPGLPKELRAPATMGEGCIVHYGKFGRLRDVRFTPESGH
jgi:hypothetical protein